MNRIVSPSEVSKIRLWLKNAVTGNKVCSDLIEALPDFLSNRVTFLIPTTAKLYVGTYYKVQLAYIAKDGTEGYYSSVAVVKYTSKPVVSLNDYNVQVLNSAKNGYFVGRYFNDDSGEKVYDYKFNLYSSSGADLLMTSDWQIHDSTSDTELNTSVDYWQCNYNFDKLSRYLVSYTIRTVNNLEVTTPRYSITFVSSIQPQVVIGVKAKNNYDDGFINVLVSDLAEIPRKVSGSFLLQRSSSKDNYTKWITITEFQLIAQELKDYSIKDFTCEHGIEYQYSLQQFNKKGVYSDRVLSNKETCYFEDIFLSDGERSLKVRFNPQVNNFKTVKQETKKVTLGSKYPYIFRNAAVGYKEFSIGGLVSYLMDDNQYFYKWPSRWYAETQPTDKNIFIERDFKLEVLDWLNNNKTKLFRSPYEGSYLVQMTNVSLTPNNTVGRMLHQFTATASQVADYTEENMMKFGFIKQADPFLASMKYETIRLTDVFESGAMRDSSYNFCKDKEVYFVSIEDCPYGSSFQIQDARIIIGATMSYTIETDTPITNVNCFGIPRWYDSVLALYTNMPGQVTIGYLEEVEDTYDLVDSVNNRQIIETVMGISIDENILDKYKNVKTEIIAVNSMSWDVSPIIDISTQIGWNNYKQSTTTYSSHEFAVQRLKFLDPPMYYRLYVQDAPISSGAQKEFRIKYVGNSEPDVIDFANNDFARPYNITTRIEAEDLEGIYLGPMIHGNIVLTVRTKTYSFEQSLPSYEEYMLGKIEYIRIKEGFVRTRDTTYEAMAATSKIYYTYDDVNETFVFASKDTWKYGLTHGVTYYESLVGNFNMAERVQERKRAYVTFKQIEERYFKEIEDYLEELNEFVT